MALDEGKTTKEIEKSISNWLAGETSGKENWQLNWQELGTR
jgi:poly(3-hydroxyalkanoate) synthetase